MFEPLFVCLGRCGSSEGIPHTTTASSLGESGGTKGLPQRCDFNARTNGWSAAGSGRKRSMTDWR